MPSPPIRTVPPQYGPEKSISILEDLIRASNQLRAEAWNSPSRKEWIDLSHNALIAAVGNQHPSIHKFELAQCGIHSPRDTKQVRLDQANRQLESRLAVMRSVVTQLGWSLSGPAQVFLPAGSSHDAYVQIRKIVKSAISSITIVDSYVDETLWSLLTNAPANAPVKVLTNTMTKDFALEARKHVTQHGTTVEIRRTKNYHDRFIVIDEAKCWHLGASIKDAGNKAFAMSDMHSRLILDAIKKDVEATWNAATPVPF